MPVLRSYKGTLLLYGLLCTTSLSVFASAPSVTIKQVETSLSGDEFVVNAEIQYELSHKATEALKNGVPLYWSYIFTVDEQNRFLWNSRVTEQQVLYRIEYHALLNMFRVSNENNGKSENFTTLAAALEQLSTVRNYPLINKSVISDGKTYLASMKVVFEKESLPLPLRPIAYLNSQWYLSSTWYVWTLKK